MWSYENITELKDKIGAIVATQAENMAHHEYSVSSSQSSGQYLLKLGSVKATISHDEGISSSSLRTAESCTPASISKLLFQFHQET